MARAKPTPAPSVRTDSELMAAILKASGDPLRLDIIRLLARDSFGVQELARIFAMPQPGMSHHLKVLTSAGLLSSRRQGTSIFYRRSLYSAHDRFSPLISGIFASIDALALPDDVAARAEAVHRERAKLSRLFFERNADRWREQQAQLCGLEQYLSSICEFIDAAGIGPSGSALEVGPGEGELLQELSRRFRSVVAVDESQPMIDAARRNLSGADSTIEFVQSDLASYLPDERRFDVIVINMVLHHLTSPADALHHLSALTASDGYLIVADLCAHDQEWTRSSCGDLWLGFEPEELANWGASAGFESVDQQFLGLKNGFQIQLALFRKPRGGGKTNALDGGQRTASGVTERSEHRAITKVD